MKKKRKKKNIEKKKRKWLGIDRVCKERQRVTD